MLGGIFVYNGYYGFYPGANLGSGLMGNMGNIGGMGAAAYNYGNAARGLGAFAGLRSTFRGINWGGILTNTQKTLNVINQAIPVFYQVKPIFNNAKTMFKIAGAMSDDKKATNGRTNNNGSGSYSSPLNNSDSPQFFA